MPTATNTATSTASKAFSEAVVLHPSATLAEFAARLRFEDIPVHVRRRFEDLMLDTMASILAGSTAGPVQIMANFAQTMGPSSGSSEDFVRRTHTSPTSPPWSMRLPRISSSKTMCTMARCFTRLRS